MKDDSSSEMVPLVVLALFALFCLADATTHREPPTPGPGHSAPAPALIPRMK